MAAQIRQPVRKLFQLFLLMARAAHRTGALLPLHLQPIFVAQVMAWQPLRPLAQAHGHGPAADQAAARHHPPVRQHKLCLL